jgi:hypothetical protein
MLKGEQDRERILALSSFGVWSETTTTPDLNTCGIDAHLRVIADHARPAFMGFRPHGKCQQGQHSGWRRT